MGCSKCHGTGNEICDNPDHGFIDAIGGELGRLGCPACGHDELHRIPNTVCDACNGTGRRHEMDDLRARTALEEVRRLNRLRNDLDDYLFELAEWGLGKQEYAPNPADYGVNPKPEDVSSMSIPEKAKEILKLTSHVIELCEQIKIEKEPKTEEADSYLSHLGYFNELVKRAFNMYESSIREIAGE